MLAIHTALPPLAKNIQLKRNGSSNQNTAVNTRPASTLPGSLLTRLLISSRPSDEVNRRSPRCS